MVGYAKLFSSILASTIWNEDATTCKVWITMLAMKDRYGVVEGTIPGLAVLARVTVDECERAITILSAPDEHSRTKTSEGRRIEPHQDGWLVVNHDVYRDRESADERREKARKRVARHRSRNAVTPDVTHVTPGNARLRHADADADADAVQKGAASRRGLVVASLKPADVSEPTWAEWVGQRRQKRATVTPKVLESWRKRATAAGMTLEEAMTYSLAQGHMGFFPPSKPNSNGKPSKPVTHIPNMPLGSPACGCEGCEKARAKMREGSKQ